VHARGPYGIQDEQQDIRCRGRDAVARRSVARSIACIAAADPIVPASMTRPLSRAIRLIRARLRIVTDEI